MRVIVDAVAAGNGSAGLVVVRELALRLPGLRPQHEYLFVVRRDLASTVDFPPTVQTLVPPPPLQSLPLRVAWEHVVLPQLTRGFKADVAFSPFNVVPTVWPRPAPRVAVT